MEHADPGGVSDGIGAAHGVEFLQQRTDMVFRGMRRNAEPARDLLVRRTLRQQRKHFQLSDSECNARVVLRPRSRRRNNDVRFVAPADQLDPVDVRQDGRDPVGNSRIGDIDRQPYPISRAQFSQAAGLSPICSLIRCIWPPLRSSISASFPTLSGPSDFSSGRSLLSGLPSQLTSTSP